MFIGGFFIQFPARQKFLFDERSLLLKPNKPQCSQKVD